MDEKLTKYFKRSVRNWWVSILIGILAIGLGLWCATAPNATLLALSFIFVAGFLISGFFGLVFSLTNINTFKGWGWSLASAIIDLIIAIILLTMPENTLMFLILYVGFWIMLQSLWGITASLQLKSLDIKDWIWLMISSVLGLILSFFLIARPEFALGFIVILTAFGFVTYGFVRVYYGWKLKQIKDHYDSLEI